MIPPILQICNVMQLSLLLPLIAMLIGHSLYRPRITQRTLFSSKLNFLKFCDPMDCSLPDSSVHGILQARMLEWVAILFFRGSSHPRGWTWVSCIAGRCFSVWAAREALTQLCKALSLYSLTLNFTKFLWDGYFYSSFTNNMSFQCVKNFAKVCMTLKSRYNYHTIQSHYKPLIINVHRTLSSFT